MSIQRRDIQMKDRERVNIVKIRRTKIVNIKYLQLIGFEGKLSSMSELPRVCEVKKSLNLLKSLILSADGNGLKLEGSSSKLAILLLEYINLSSWSVTSLNGNKSSTHIIQNHVELDLSRL